METNYNRDKEKKEDKFTDGSRSGRVWGGLILVTVGALLVAREVGVYFPYWLFSWPMILIAVGIFVGARHGFRSWGWAIPIAIGTAFLVGDIAPEFRHFFWPAVIILVGLVMILRPRRSSWRTENRWENFQNAPMGEGFAHQDDSLDSVAIFGGTRKNVITKNFKGGDAVSIFGGTELNLMQADFEGVARLELTQVFGGAKLIVPSNWKIQSDVVTIFGSIDDRRSTNVPTDSNKVLRLDGTCIFGGIEIKSF
jgi:hypothetical protein